MLLNLWMWDTKNIRAGVGMRRNKFIVITFLAFLMISCMIVPNSLCVHASAPEGWVAFEQYVITPSTGSFLIVEARNNGTSPILYMLCREGSKNPRDAGVLQPGETLSKEFFVPYRNGGLYSLNVIPFGENIASNLDYRLDVYLRVKPSRCSL